ncbi:2-oxo-hepta-3-ene-1,7-dioic acid hydratase [Sphingobium subterraneum]|uniref:2-oxo-hept-3-ene-1,7-dioate hydratase n=1 Tax=Sphingobium subterraneum TaxID=627688 RepID=A0A841IXQ7_9SPHN|nr:2-oxo-hepta-3-ene-1,7-dioic acid hydratase [Sphingobium subterraneum]MBB6123080.1 2-oxo-hept-3-ene-1,7-dioate hydratase [Sphingobium subterraneum]
MATPAISVLGGSVGTTLSRDAVQAAADALDSAERSRTQIRLLTDTHPDMTMDDAYAVQEAWVQKKVAGGDPVVGWKIGLTSKAMQAALSIDIPDSGVLLDSMKFANGADIARERFIQPRIEAEIAFVMRDAVPADASPAQILAATDYVAPALEILDTRIFRKDPVSGRLRTVLDTISDNAANGGIVMGDAIRDFANRDLGWVGAIVSRNDEVEETGLGAGVLGDPLVSVAWLAQRLGAYGQHIEAGQIVLSGSFIRPVEAPPGSRIVGDFGPWGKVTCSFL